MKCCTCNSNVTKTNSGVTCAQCKKNYHWTCGSLTEKVIRDINNGTTTQWKCSQCDKRKSTPISNTSTSVVTIDEHDNSQSIQRINSVVNDMQKYLNEKFGEWQEVTRVLSDHGSRIKQVEEDNKTILYNTNNLDVRLDNLEQAALSNSVEINGVPLEAPDDPADIIKRISSNISYPTSPEDWSNIYRLFRQTNQDKPPSIIVFFKDSLKRDGFLSAAKSHRGMSTAKIGIKGSDNLIFVNEHLTKARKKLFYTAKAFKNSNNFKYLWTNKGKIYLRKSDGSQAINVNFYTNFDKLNGNN